MDCLIQPEHTITTDIEGARNIPHRGQVQGGQKVVFVGELQPRIEAQDRGNNGQAEGWSTQS
jgi:hypothetical protein